MPRVVAFRPSCWSRVGWHPPPAAPPPPAPGAREGSIGRAGGHPLSHRPGREREGREAPGQAGREGGTRACGAVAWRDPELLAPREGEARTRAKPAKEALCSGVHSARLVASTGWCACTRCCSMASLPAAAARCMQLSPACGAGVRGGPAGAGFTRRSRVRVPSAVTTLSDAPAACSCCSTSTCPRSAAVCAALKPSCAGRVLRPVQNTSVRV